MKSRIEKVLFIALAFTLLVILTTKVSSKRGGSPEKRTAPQAQAFSAQRPQVAQTYGKLPLSFEANQGQTDPRVKFLSRGRGYALFLTGDEMVMSLPSRQSSVLSRQPSASRNWKLETGNSKFAGGNLPGFSLRRGTPGFGSLLPTSDFQFPIPDTSAPKPRPAAPSVVRLQLVGANARAKAVGLEELPGRSNYFIGNDPKKWRTNVATYAKVKYQGVYPGVDLVYYGHEGQMEYDFVVAPGADPRAIRLAIGSGQSKFDNRNSKIDANGDLVIPTDPGEVRFHKPVVYQEQSSVVSGQLSVATTKTLRTTDHGPRTTDNGQSSIVNRQLLDGKYVLLAENRIGFEVRGYDPTRPLVIDPVLAYSTYLGGSGEDWPFGIAVDSAGNSFLTGYTVSTDFPTVSAVQGANAGNHDVFVTKLNASGSALVYSTYLGGSADDYGGGGAGAAIALDSDGNAYVTGWTDSTDFPTKNPLQSANAGGHDAFAFKLDTTGSQLVYSTYLGGSGTDEAWGIAVDSAGAAYLIGHTNSSNFPTSSALFPVYAGGDDAFVAKLNPAGSALVYSTYLGGSGREEGRSIAVDAAGNAYATGWTASYDFPTAHALQPNNNTCCDYPSDWFITKLNPTGSALVFSTYLGGPNDDYAHGIAVDPAGNVYVSGSADSAGFPTVNALYPTGRGGYYDCVVAKLDPTGSTLIYSTFLGGSGNYDAGWVAADSFGNAYVAGYTDSTDFPTANPLQSANAGGFLDAFVAKLNPTGSALVFSTYLGGSAQDQAFAIAVDSRGGVYVAGETNSINFPTANPLQPNLAGGIDVFVAKIQFSPVSLSPAAVNLGSEPLGVTSDSGSATLTNQGSTALTISSIGITGTNAGDFAQTNNCGTSVAAGTSCTINVTFTPTAVGSRTATLSVTDDALGSPHTAALTGTGTAPVVTLSSTALTFPVQPVGSTSAPQTVTLTNTGSGVLTISSLAVTGANAGDFGQTNTCSASLAVGAHCNINVSFAPTAGGSRTASLSVSDNAAGSPHTVGLTGTGAVVPLVTLSPSALSFTSQALGTTGTPQTVLLTNPGAAALTISSVAIGGVSAGDFGQTNNCGSSVAAGAHCTLTVTFTPTAVGARTATLSVSDNASGSPHNVSLTGTGSGPLAALSPGTLTFSTQPVGITSAAQPVILSNTGNAALTISSIGITGTNAGDFAQTNNCGASLAAGNSCTMSVTFTPLAGGARAATLSVTDNASGSPHSVGLSGTGAAVPELTIDLGHSGNFTQNQTDATYTISVSNLGTLPSSGTVSVVDTLPTGLTATALSGTGWTCTLATLTCTRSDVLGGTSSHPPITLMVDVAADAPASVTNTATVSGGGDITSANNTATDLTTIVQPPTADAVTPTPASSANQTFSLSYSVHNGKGYTDLTWVSVLFNPGVNGGMACYVLYRQPANQLYLRADSGMATLGPLTPGSAGTLANSQCTVNGAGTTVSGSGATLTLNLSVSASSSFLGTKNIYMLALDSEGSSSGWQNRGTWTPIGPDTAPTADSVTPTPASGANQTFSLAYSAQNGRGYTDLTWVKALFNSRLAGMQGCYVQYYQPYNRFYLQDDAGTTSLGPLTPGAPGTVSNSQCTVNGAGTTVTGSGATLTLNLSVSAAPGFLGTRNIYMQALDSEDTNSGWQDRGAWTPIGPDTAPTADSVTPTPASGANQTFSLAYSVRNGNGYADLTWVKVLFNSRLAGMRGCYVQYYRPYNQLYLQDDAGTTSLGPLTPGAPGTVSNSQCTLNGAGTTVTGSGATLTLNLSVSASTSFLGTQNIYMQALDIENSSSGWQDRGAWTP